MGKSKLEQISNKRINAKDLFQLLSPPLASLSSLPGLPLYHPRLDPLEAGVLDAPHLQRREDPPQQHPQDARPLGVVDVRPILPQHADLESDLLDLLQQLPSKPDRQGIRWLDEKRTKRHWNCQHLKP